MSPLNLELYSLDRIIMWNGYEILSEECYKNKGLTILKRK
jgi:hypothetical protein